ncbi:hypothetical protein D3C83_122060 [compost metagenome]
MTALDQLPLRRDGVTRRQVFMPELRAMVAVLDRRALDPDQAVAGPMVIADASATTWLPPAWSAVPDRQGNLLLEIARP